MRAERQENIDALWTEYLATQNLEAKNKILTHYLGLVVTVVKRMMPRYKEYSEQEDLISAGILGLIGAVNKFDESYGVKFETYATVRIRGEVIDYLRKQDWAPTTLRKKISTIQQAYESMEAELGRVPLDSEVAQQLHLTETEMRKTLETAHMFNVINFEAMIDERYSEIPSSNHEDDPQRNLEKKETKTILKQLIENLPEKERMVIVLHYYEGFTMKNIAKVLKISESRVSQIHSKVLSLMRAALSESYGR
jgi:RNA polymerase sigma factor for flagellar operon FliA